MKYGAYDPLYPNGIVSVASPKEIFGVRFLAADSRDHVLADGKKLDFNSIIIRPNQVDRNFDVAWRLNGKQIRLRWCRLAEKMICGRLEFEEGLEILAEMYVPMESRLDQEWPNFTRQRANVFAGELISPYRSYENNAVLFCTDSEPAAALGYNNREKQLAAFCETGLLKSVAPPDIWNDLGISWRLGAHFTKSFSFILHNGSAKEMLKALEEENHFDEFFALGRAELEKQAQAPSLTGSGMLGAIGEAFSALLPYNTLYKPHTDRRYIIVDRTWARSDDGWGIQFCWDTFLSSWSSAWIDPELAKENMVSGYDAQLPDGRVPLHIRPGNDHKPEPPITAGRAQHIVQGLTLWNTYLHTRDKEWAERCYQGAKRVHAWWFGDRGDGQRNRDALSWGLLGFGYDPEKEMGELGARCQPYVAKAQYAYFETYDDSPQWTTGEYFKSVKGMADVKEEEVVDEAKYKAHYHTVDIYTLERCCLYAVECQCLSRMAKELGHEQDAADFDRELREMAARIDEKMWCEEDGCYYNLKFDGTFSKKQSPDCFMPLMTGLVPEERKNRLLQILKDESKFWGKYVIPSIAKDDPAFPNQKYWRGQIWPPQTLWVYLALKGANEHGLAWEFAQKMGRMLAREWIENGYTPENYNAYTGRCSGAQHYNWGVLMGLPLLEELVEFRTDRVIFGNPLAEDGTELKNILVDGRRYSLLVKDGQTVVFCDGKQIAAEPGKVEVARNAG